MADHTTFRSALNGFNRSDVVAYIEALCAEHEKALQQSRTEADGLRRQLDEAKASLTLQISRTEELQKQLDETQTALESTESALEEAMVMLTETPEPEEAAPDYAAMELEAYRRAESMERTAAERANRLQQQLSDVLDQVSARYEEAGQEIQALSEDIRTNIKRLEDTLSDLDVIFDETTGAFETMDSADYVAAE